MNENLFASVAFPHYTFSSFKPVFQDQELLLPL